MCLYVGEAKVRVFGRMAGGGLQPTDGRRGLGGRAYRHPIKVKPQGYIFSKSYRLTSRGGGWLDKKFLMKNVKLCMFIEEKLKVGKT